MVCCLFWAWVQWLVLAGWAFCWCRGVCYFWEEGRRLDLKNHINLFWASWVPSFWGRVWGPGRQSQNHRPTCLPFVTFRWVSILLHSPTITSARQLITSCLEQIVYFKIIKQSFQGFHLQMVYPEIWRLYHAELPVHHHVFWSFLC